MKQTDIKLLEKILDILKKSRAKYLTSEMIAQEIGRLPEHIQTVCATFNPLVTIDYTFDLRTIMGDIEQYLQTLNKPKTRKTLTSKKNVSSYQRVTDFVYDKMTFGGIVDKSVTLTDQELREIKLIVSEELKARRALKKKK